VGHPSLLWRGFRTEEEVAFGIDQRPCPRRRRFLARPSLTSGIQAYSWMMLMNTSSTPPSDLYRGELGPELVVLSDSIVRIAQRVDADSEIETADGPVKGRVGDFVLTTAEGERYPIPASIFYGTYQLLGGIGNRFVGRRLLHARRAWEVQSDNAEFNYGPSRGKVAAPIGGWIYRSDEDDYGYINAEAKGKAHTIVGTASELEGARWHDRFHLVSQLMSFLPPAMTLIALIAYSTALNGHELVSEILLAIEGACLLLGIAVVWWIRKDRWVLKSALTSALEVAREFQGAVQLLGQTPSYLFPSMTLWRAAQGESGITMPSPAALSDLKMQVSKTFERVRQEITSHRATERHAGLLSWTAAAIVLGCIGYASWTHSLLSELLAIWLPSLAGAVHATVIRRQVARRIGAASEFLSVLAFVRAQLFALAPDDKLDANDARATQNLSATLSVLCRAVAEHTQHQLQFAAAEVLEVPV
jgi:hypothetical protein